MVFKMVYLDPGVGGHVYCRLFSATGPDNTYAQLANGSITVRRGPEFEAMRAAMPGVEFVEQKLQQP